MLENKQKALHFVIPATGVLVPLLLKKFGDNAVYNHLVSKGAIVHPAQMHHWQRPSIVVPLAVGIPMVLGVLFDLVKDPAKQLMMLEFAAPMIVHAGWNISEHFQLQSGYTPPAIPGPPMPPPAFPGAPGTYPGAVQVGRAVHYGFAPRYTTAQGSPRPTYGNR